MAHIYKILGIKCILSQVEMVTVRVDKYNPLNEECFPNQGEAFSCES